MEVDAGIELYESDRPRIERVAARLRQHVGARRQKDAFIREVAERFAEEGYLVDIRLTTVDGGGDDVVFHPCVTISGRVDIEPGYDHERQGRELRAAELGERGPVGMPGHGGIWTPKGVG
jgi:hypothetical protein